MIDPLSPPAFIISFFLTCMLYALAFRLAKLEEKIENKRLKKELLVNVKASCERVLFRVQGSYTLSRCEEYKPDVFLISFKNHDHDLTYTVSTMYTWKELRDLSYIALEYELYTLIRRHQSALPHDKTFSKTAKILGVDV